jgi:hypothetical protein
MGVVYTWATNWLHENNLSQHQPQFVVKPDCYSFSNPPQGRDFSPANACQWRHRRAQQKRTHNANPVQGIAEHAALQRFKVDRDVRQLRHCARLS